MCDSFSREQAYAWSAGQATKQQEYDIPADLYNAGMKAQAAIEDSFTRATRQRRQLLIERRNTLNQHIDVLDQFLRVFSD